MKVVSINAVFRYGSTGRNVFEIHNYLKSHGIASYVFVGTKTQKEDNVFQIGNIFDWKIHSLLSRLFGLQGYFSFFATKNLIKKLNKIKPDIVHLNNLHANYINLPLLLNYLNKNKTPIVITLHDCWFYTGRCMHYSNRGCFLWRNGCHNCPALKEGNISWFFDRSHKMWSDKRKLLCANHALGIVGVSSWISNEAKQSFLKCSKIIRTIYNWVDLEKFAPTKETEACKKKYQLVGKKIILCVSSGWNEKKGLLRIIEVAQKIDSNSVILMVGKTPKKFVFPNNIINIPETNNINELVAYYSLADLLLQVSPEETFGKVVAEALACGTPVVAINTTANPELIGEKCGVVVKDDSQSILEGISVVIENGKKYYTNNCRYHAEKFFSKNKNIKEYIDLYQELTSSK